MVSFFIKRPIGILVSTITLALLGILSYFNLPVSLLPDIAIPEIIIQTDYANSTSSEISSIIINPIENSLSQINNLTNIQTIIKDGSALTKLRFEYKTNIDLAYIEVNEKIDGLLSTLPRDLKRPKVIKVNTSDIPIFNINIRYRDLKQKSSFIHLSDFCETVVKTRLEQLPEISMVDISGISKSKVIISPKYDELNKLGLTDRDLAQIIKSNNVTLSNLELYEGNYILNIDLHSDLKNKEDIENLLINVTSRKQGDSTYLGKITKLKDLVNINIEEEINGSYFINNGRSVVLSIIKHSNAPIYEVRNKINEVIETLQNDYPNLEFKFSQDQTELLDISIQNLLSSILFGAICSFVVLIIFIRNFKIALLISLSVPISLCFTFLVFYITGTSINIVSLGGIVLGIGMLVDCSIIVIESINSHFNDSANINDACIKGTEEVIFPLFTSILTNLAVFIPLIFLSGISGSIFQEQAISISISLLISLLVSYIFIPVVYKRINSKIKRADMLSNNKNTFLYYKIENYYVKMVKVSLEKPFIVIIFLFIICTLGIISINRISVSGIPTISQDEIKVKLRWNKPYENFFINEELRKITYELRSRTKYIAFYIGEQHFLLSKEYLQNPDEATIILKLKNANDYAKTVEFLENKMKGFPQLSFEIGPLKNLFEKIFDLDEPDIELKVASNNGEIPPYNELVGIFQRLNINGINVQKPLKSEKIFLSINQERILLYEVAYEQVYSKIKTLFNANNVLQLQSGSKILDVIIQDISSLDLEQKINHAFVINSDRQYIPLKNFVDFTRSEGLREIYSGKSGPYYSYGIKTNEPHKTIKKIRQIMDGLSTSISYVIEGKYFENKKNIDELKFIMIISILMIYIILASQFESLKQPLIIIVNIIIAVLGSIFILYITGNTLNIMSAIGIITLIGIADNDAILKIDSINKSLKTVELKDAIIQGSKKRFKSQIMTSLTTMLALIPILFSSGIGAELQYPLTISVISGMFFALILSGTFIPLFYYFNTIWTIRKKS